MGTGASSLSHDPFPCVGPFFKVPSSLEPSNARRWLPIWQLSPNLAGDLYIQAMHPSLPPLHLSTSTLHVCLQGILSEGDIAALRDYVYAQSTGEWVDVDE